MVPSTAIYHDRDGKPAVWIYDPAKRTVSLRAVTVEGYREEGVLIASGLADGDWVVAAGAHKLREGQAVTPWEGDGAPSPSAAGAPRA
jgi:multidrug efflux system membrane fusion protein